MQLVADRFAAHEDGLSARALENIAKNGGSLVVTVDCGIASIAEAEEARRLGLELLITDHHEFKSQLPAADVLDAGGVELPEEEQAAADSTASAALARARPAVPVTRLRRRWGVDFMVPPR